MSRGRWKAISEFVLHVPDCYVAGSFLPYSNDREVMEALTDPPSLST